MKSRDFLDLMKLSLSVLVLAMVTLVACTIAEPSLSRAGEEPPPDKATERGVIIRAIDLDEISAYSAPPFRHYRQRQLARLRADADQT